MPDAYRPIPFEFEELPPEEMQARADAFYAQMRRRRSIRFFSDRPVPKQLIERAIQTAGTAPSGAHQQPWRFVAVSNPDLKRTIREAAEQEERESYERRMSDEWLDAIAPMGTTWQKPYLEVVPWIVVLFAEQFGFDADGERVKHYYVQESCGIAAGFFIAALHQMGLATLTHTPSPMRFLNDILGRPKNERPYILFPIGYPAAAATVPDLQRKPLHEIVQWDLGA